MSVDVNSESMSQYPYGVRAPRLFIADQMSDPYANDIQLVSGSGAPSGAEGLIVDTGIYFRRGATSATTIYVSVDRGVSWTALTTTANATGTSNTSFNINDDATAGSDQDPILKLSGGDGGSEIIISYLQQDSSADLTAFWIGGGAAGTTSKTPTFQIGKTGEATASLDAVLKFSAATDAAANATADITYLGQEDTIQINNALIVDMNAALDLDKALTAAGDGANVAITINSATASAQAGNFVATQLTTARTAGAVDAVTGATTSLAGDLNSVVYSDFRAKAPTDGGGTVVHAALTIEAGHDIALNLAAAATGESDIVVGDNLASALEIREASNTYLKLVTTNSSERVEITAPALVLNLADPGTGQAIPVLRDAYVGFTTGGSGETNTCAIPTRVGQRLILSLDTDGGGDRVVTFSQAISGASTVATFATAGQALVLLGVSVTGALRWRVESNIGSVALT